MHKIKLIGPKYLIGPLAILGIETFPAESEAEACTALENASTKREPTLIFLTERLAADLRSEVEKLNRRTDMNVVLIPDNQGSTGLAASQIDKLVRNSIGAEVIIRK
jgi:V/A-type H+-transporting ATPase subunit F